MIYGHMYAHDHMHVTRGAKRPWVNEQGFYFECHSEKQLCASGALEPAGTKDIWWDSCYVGEDMLRELSEHYYRTVLFLFEADCELIPKFRITDQWGLGLVPGDIVTNIGISVNCASYDFAGLDSILGDESDFFNPNNGWNNTNANNGGWGAAASGWGDESPTGRKPCEALSLSLEHLFGFKVGTSISIQLSVETISKCSYFEGHQWMCEAVIPVLLPTLQRLKVAGYKLRVVLNSEDRWAVDCSTKNDFTFLGDRLNIDAVQTAFELVST